MIELKHPLALLLLTVPLGLALLWVRFGRRRPSLALPTLGLVAGALGTYRARVAWLPRVLRLLALAVMVLAIARPREGERFQDVITNGVDMVVALDVSGSMKAEDFRPKNRLHVAKEVVRNFIDSRRRDRLGLVVFAGRAYTQCPLTLDYGLLKQLVAAVGFDSVDEDGTAIGMGISTALNRLRSSKAKSRVVVLVTDGINNRGAIDPMTAAGLARTLGAKIYTIGVGSGNPAPIPIDTPQGVQYVYQQLPLDEASLTKISESTGGYYFRATDTASFEEALRRIGELETTRIETREYTSYDERADPLLALAGGLLVLEGILAATWLRRLP